MITAGDVQYEPQQTKHAHITPKVLLVIAGDYSTHSQAMKRTIAHFNGSASATSEEVATFYGRAIQALKLKEAEDLYLAPLGLNSDSFLSQQSDMAPHFVSLLTDQMQAYRGEEVEALVIGPQNGVVSVYGVDTKGMIACHDDVGFAAIGGGAWHAKSRLMTFGYASSNVFSTSLVVSYAAKKISELAPGVGQSTDIKIVFRDHIEELRPDVGNRLHELFLEYKEKASNLGLECIGEMFKYITTPIVQDANEPAKGIPGGSAQTNERPASPAAETPRSNEVGKEKGPQEGGE
jgi:20S proteasome alpha/beta subunit